MSLLSIIIVTYNNADTICPCLHSLNTYIPPDFSAEIILIDNASSDDTVKNIQRGIKSFKSSIVAILYVNKTNTGFAPAVNQGLNIARGDYVMLLNPDTEFTQNMCAVLVNHLRSNPSWGIVAPQHRSPAGSIRHSCRRFPTYWSVFCEMSGLSKLFTHNGFFNGWKMGDFDHLSSREVEQPMGACLLTTRGAIQEVGLMDEQFVMFFNDVDWCRRFKNKNYKIMYLRDAALIHHGGHSVFQRRSYMILLSHWNLFCYFQKYYRRWWERLLNLAYFPVLMIAAGFRILMWNILQKK